MASALPFLTSTRQILPPGNLVANFLPDDSYRWPICTYRVGVIRRSFINPLHQSGAVGQFFKNIKICIYI